MKISRIMSTQHPDNVSIPFFAEKPLMEGEDEIKEAFYSFSHLGIDEQLWDAEGKEVDLFVAKKLFSRYQDYFEKNILGQDKFLTLRVPNPNIEKNEGKVLLDTLNSIPRNFDIAKQFYGKDIAPIFEVVIPMCSSEKDLIRVHEYYKKFIVKLHQKRIYNRDIKISEWIGDANPKDIRVTPLFETQEAILNADVLTKRYIQFEKIKNLQRVWFARSDPALNYGSAATVLMVKIGLMKLQELQDKLSIDIFPIIGCGSAPFRGNYTPLTVRDMALEYPSVQTFTAQSAFKYDYPVKEVIEGVENLEGIKRQKPMIIEEKEAKKVIVKIRDDYQQCIPLIADHVNLMSSFVPERRRRKLHIDLFGYAREAVSVKLPRAIKFCAALYSLGLPPELLGLSSLQDKDFERIREWYPCFDNDLHDALQYVNRETLKYFPLEVQKKVENVIARFPCDTNEVHNHITLEIAEAVKKNKVHLIQDRILTAGKLRQFLG